MNGIERNVRFRRHLSMLPATISELWLWDSVTQAVRAIRRHFKIRRARIALAKLPDRALNDIGIGRAEIHAITAHGRNRRGEAVD